MGLSSLWNSLLGSRVKEITPHRPFSFEQQEAHAVELATSRGPQDGLYGVRAAAFSEVQLSQPTSTPEAKKAKRRSRGFSLSKAKSEGDLRKRKSWFGSRPAAEDAPEVPALPAQRMASSGLAWNGMNAAPEPDLERPGTALTTDDQISWSRPATPEEPKLEKRKSRRLSLGKALMGSRKRSKSTVSQVPQMPKLEKRQSVLGGHRDMIPPIPSVPATSSELVNPETGFVPLPENSFNKRQSRRSDLIRTTTVDKRKSTASLRSQRSQRGSWWQSSNPFDEGGPPPVPSVPSLGWDDGTATPDSSVGLTASPDNSWQIDHTVFADSPVRTVTRGNSIKHPRPVSGVSLTSRKLYTPKSAASGYLRSTSQRSSRRHSLLEDGDGGMICLSDEQQREWEKLKNLMVTLEARQDASPVYDSSEVTSLAENEGVLGMLRQYEEDEDKRHRRIHSNAEALAALEFGTAK